MNVSFKMAAVLASLASAAFCEELPVGGICAHQGDCGEFPGNTVEAIASAVRKGAAMIEFDVQRCKSGEFVLMHDSTIDKLTTGTGKVRERTLAELKSYTLRSAKRKGLRIPTLDEVLDVIPKDGVILNVHCYAGAANVCDLVRLLEKKGRLHQSILTGNPDLVRKARKAVPAVQGNNIKRPGPRNRDWTDEENERFLSETIASGCSYLQLSRPWPRKFSDAAHAAGVKVIYFKSDDPASLGDLVASRGIDFVMTNRLEPMVAAYAKLPQSGGGESNLVRGDFEFDGMSGMFGWGRPLVVGGSRTGSQRAFARRGCQPAWRASASSTARASTIPPPSGRRTGSV